MKTINSQIEKKEDSKLKKAFKKMKNAFVIGSAALIITCGGAETDTHNDNNNSSVNKLPPEIEAYADEINLKHTYNVFNHLGLSGDLEANPLLTIYADFCSEKYDSVEVKNYLDQYLYYDLNNITSPKEFIFKTRTKEFPEILNTLKGNERVTMGIKERARPPPGILYHFNDLNFERYYSKFNIGVFSYYYNFDKNVLESVKPPAVILCYARYNDDLIEQNISFGRMVVIPYDGFMNAATTIMSKEEIMKELSVYFTSD